MDALHHDPDDDIRTSHLSGEMIISKILEKNQIGRRLLLAGMKESNIVENKEAYLFTKSTP